MATRGNSVRWGRVMQQKPTANFDSLSDVELLVIISQCQSELRRRGATRTSNCTGDFAEMLVCKALGLKQAATAAKNVDAIGPDGKRYQIKARRLTPWNKSRQLGGLRDLNDGHFDYLAGVLFDKHYVVMRAALIPHCVVGERAKWMKRSNAHRFMLTDAIWNLSGVIDISDKMRRAISVTGDNGPEASQ